MKIDKLDFTINDVISALENPFICSLAPIEYGKAIQTAVEEYVGYMVNNIAGQTILDDISKNDELIKEFNYSNNGPGFDRLLSQIKKKVQIKFRQTDGKTPYSKQIHFENTRRHSDKHKNKSADTGLIRYGVSEFDYVIVVLCHIVNGKRKKYNEWSFSLVSSNELEDVNNIGFCLPKIPSCLLLENKYDNIYMLTNKLKELSYV